MKRHKLGMWNKEHGGKPNPGSKVWRCKKRISKRFKKSAEYGFPSLGYFLLQNVNFWKRKTY